MAGYFHMHMRADPAGTCQVCAWVEAPLACSASAHLPRIRWPHALEQPWSNECAWLTCD